MAHIKFIEVAELRAAIGEYTMAPWLPNEDVGQLRAFWEKVIRWLASQSFEALDDARTRGEALNVGRWVARAHQALAMKRRLVGQHILGICRSYVDYRSKVRIVTPPGFVSQILEPDESLERILRRDFANACLLSFGFMPLDITHRGPVRDTIGGLLESPYLPGSPFGDVTKLVEAQLDDIDEGYDYYDWVERWRCPNDCYDAVLAWLPGALSRGQAKEVPARTTRKAALHEDRRTQGDMGAREGVQVAARELDLHTVRCWQILSKGEHWQ